MSRQMKRMQRELLKEMSLAYLGGKRCCKCGVDSLPTSCYDFHHCKNIKEIEISKMISRGMDFSLIKLELDKCMVMCKNCHAYIHHFNIYVDRCGDVL